MHWEADELRTVQLGHWRKRPGLSKYKVIYVPYQVPAPYDRIVSQLIAESVHAKGDLSHESCRRGVYAMETLDAFGDELKAFGASEHPPATFRSRVLTPILQRQRAGIYDAYRPFVEACIAGPGQIPSIEAVTQLYLSSDPVDPVHILTYCRNLIYVLNARWHLGIILNGMDDEQEKRISHYKRVLANHDKIMSSSLAETFKQLDPRGIPLLSYTEIEVIFDERLETFFMEELAHVVGTLTPSFVTFSSHCPSIPTA